MGVISVVKVLGDLALGILQSVLLPLLKGLVNLTDIQVASSFFGLYKCLQQRLLLLKSVGGYVICNTQLLHHFLMLFCSS